MASQENITVIKSDLNLDAATRCFRAMTGDKNAEFERRIYYPYHSFSADCSVPTLRGRRSVAVDCLVDGVNALGATSDAFTTERKTIDAEELLPMTVVNEQAHRTAYSTLMQQMAKRLKMIASFDIFLAKRGIVYKTFWILRSRGALFMVDSVTGGMHPLRSGVRGVR